MNVTAITFGDYAGTARTALRGELVGAHVVALEDTGPHYFAGASLASWGIYHFGGHHDIASRVEDALDKESPDRVIVDLTRGLASPRWSGTMAQIRSVLHRHGYGGQFWTLNSADLGAGYARKRHVFVGAHHDLGGVQVRRPRTVRPAVTVADVLPAGSDLPTWCHRQPGPALGTDPHWGPANEVPVYLTNSERCAMLGIERRDDLDPIEAHMATPAALYRAVLRANLED